MVGAPNVGKSTLVNALIGRKVAGVSAKPQTTRRRILGIRTEPDAQIIFVDTPGVGPSPHRLGVVMNDAARVAAADADLVLALADASRPGTAAALEDVTATVRAPKVLVLTKADLVEKPRLLPLMERFLAEGRWAEVVPVSARERDNLEALLGVVRARLPEAPPWYGEAEAQAVTGGAQLAQEIVQEALFSRLHEEVPYGCGVQVEAVERDGGLLRVEAVVLAEREAHKPILIGAGGSMMKAVGTAARRELERVLGCRVYLTLRVKVEPDWRNRESVLSDLGYGGR